MRHVAIVWTQQKEKNIRIVDQYADLVAVRCKTKEQRTWRKSPCHKRFSSTFFEQARSDSCVRYSISGIDGWRNCYIITINDISSQVVDSQIKFHSWPVKTSQDSKIIFQFGIKSGTSNWNVQRKAQISRWNRWAEIKQTSNKFRPLSRTICPA